MLRRTPEQIEAARLRREEWWKLRQNGKLTPSEALEKQNSKAKPGPTPEAPATPPPATEAPPAPADAPIWTNRRIR